MLILDKNRSDNIIADNTSKQFYSHGRTALKYGLLYLGLKKGDSLLIPEFICDVLLHPLKNIGVKYIYYPLNKSLNPKWEQLKNLINVTTKGILMVHYFGQPQDVILYRKFCDEHGLLLIEDNAHGYGGTLNNKLLGTYGDIGISSPRKMLNTLSGGILWYNNLGKIIKPKLPAYQLPILDSMKKILSKNSPGLKWYMKKLFRYRPKFEDPTANREKPIHDCLLDHKTCELIITTDWDRIKLERQKVYNAWHEFSVSCGLKPVFKKLHSEANPLCLPAYAINRQEAIKWYDWGWKNNVDIYSWPTLPNEIIKQDGNTLNNWRRLVCFSTLTEYKS